MWANGQDASQDLLNRQRRFEPRRVTAHLQLGDPLHPTVPAVARGNEPQGESVPGGERLVLDVGGQQEVAGLLLGEAAGGAGFGGKQKTKRSAPGTLPPPERRPPE